MDPEQLVAGGRRERMLVDGVLRTERYHPDDIPARRVPVAPARMIDDIIADYAAKAAGEQLRVESSVSGGLRMELDPDLFVDAIGNVVENAIKYTPAGGVVVTAEENDDAVGVKSAPGQGVEAAPSPIAGCARPRVRRRAPAPRRTGQPGG